MRKLYIDFLKEVLLYIENPLLIDSEQLYQEVEARIEAYGIAKEEI